MPANIIPMYLMGIRPLDPGFAKVIIQPQISTLEHAAIKFPTIRGPIELKIKYVNKSLTYEITLPANMQAEVVFPCKRINIGSGYHIINET